MKKRLHLGVQWGKTVLHIMKTQRKGERLMKNLPRLALTITLVLGMGPLAWAGFSIDQPPTETALDPGDTFLVPGGLDVDDGDLGAVPPPSLGMVAFPTTPYDTDAFSLAIGIDPAAAGGLFFSFDDGDVGPGFGPPDRWIELYHTPFPGGLGFTLTNATELFLGLANNPPPIMADDDLDAFETIPAPLPPTPAYFSFDFDTPMPGYDPGDIYATMLNGVPPPPFPAPPACDDVTGMWISPNEATPVDVDAVHLVPNTVCGAFFPPGGPLCFLFSVDDSPLPPAPPGPFLDPGDIYITDCLNGFALYADDVTMLLIAPNEQRPVDIDALSAMGGSPVVPIPCPDNDLDGYLDVACGGMDCDDNDPNTFPWAPELCDGIDNDCVIYPSVPADESDDDVPAGDGHVECSPWVGSVPGILGGNDCDDNDPNESPGLVEDIASATCNDSLDNDCDLLTDSADPDCGGSSCAGSAAASIQATPSEQEESILNLLAFLLVPVAAALGIVVVRRKR
jgi:hypothetical protein